MSYLHPIPPLACFYSATLAWNLSAVDMINWLMSKEGQLVMQKDNIRSNSPREDIPKDMLAPDVLRTPGVKLQFMSQLPDYDAQLDKALKVINEAQGKK